MKPLAHTAITAGGATVYTTPGSFRSDMHDIILTNTTAGDLTFTIYIVPSGGSPSTSNAIFYGTSLPANTVTHWEGTQALDFGGSVYCSASGSGITIRLTGDEYR